MNKDLQVPTCNSKHETIEVPKRDRSRSVTKLGEPKLEMVKEEGSTDLTSPVGGDSQPDPPLAASSSSFTHKPESCLRFFGVKSYLHHFYEQVALKDPQQYEEYDEYRYLIAPKPKKRYVFFWKIIFWTGFLLLLLGTVVLLVGYLAPRRNPIVGHKDKLEIIDRSIAALNKNLDNCKIFGLAIFSVGGTLLTATLLLPTLVGVSCLDDDPNDEATPFKVHIGGSVAGVFNVDSDDDDDDQAGNKSTHKSSVGIPATEQVKSVQPRREEEAVITGSGLTKLR